MKRTHKLFMFLAGGIAAHLLLKIYYVVSDDFFYCYFAGFCAYELFSLSDYVRKSLE
jgi:hypothetical protein